MRTSTVLDRIEIHSDGAVRVRLLKLIVGPDGQIVVREPHRFSLSTLQPLPLQKALVDRHLVHLGFPGVPPEDWDRVLSHLHPERPTAKT